MVRIHIQKRRTFIQHLIFVEIFFGLPVLLLKLLTIPVSGWKFAIPILLPSATFGLFVATVVEYNVLTFIERRRRRKNPETTGDH